MKAKELLRFLKEVEEFSPEYLEKEVGVLDFEKRYDLEVSYVKYDNEDRKLKDKEGVNLFLRRSNVEF